MTTYSDKYTPRILQFSKAFFPAVKVYAYGSRARGDNIEYSDLDLMLDNGGKIDFQELDDLRVAFQASSIPYCVDLHDYHRTDPEFIKLIEPQMVEVV